MKSSPRIVALAALLLMVPALFLLNVWQSYRYRRLERDVTRVETRHRQVLEENKRLVVGIATLRSPDRIRQIAIEELELQPLDPDRIMRIEIRRDARVP